jgi:hypothetical protein
MSRRLLKFKYSDDGIVVRYEQTNDTIGEPDRFTFESKEEPRKELKDALAAMATHVVDICELTELESEIIDRITVFGITRTYTVVDDDRLVQGLVISARRSLTNSNSPMMINTPHFTDEPYSVTADPDLGVYSLECGEALHKLTKRIFAYVDGERAQQELDLTGSLNVVEKSFAGVQS